MSLRPVAVGIENATRTDEFIHLGRIYALAKGSMSNAMHFAEDLNASQRILEIFRKAATDPGLLSSPTWGSNLTQFDGLASAFVESLRSVGIFDAMLGSMRQMPLRTRAAIVAVGASGAAVDEGGWKAISELNIGSSDQLAARKAVAAIVASNELLRSLSAEAQRLLRVELQNAVAHVTDEEFLSAISNGVSPTASTGVDVDSVRFDLETLLGSVSVGQGSKLFLIMHGANAKRLAVMGGDDGFAFPQMTPSGGTIAGMTVLVADAIDEDQVMLIDASGIAASAGTVTLSTAEHATLRMSNTPDSDAALTSLFQKNLVGLKAERWFGAERVRDDAVAVISEANYNQETA